MTDADVEIAVERAIETHIGREGSLLPMLHDVQRDLGCVPERAVQLLAVAIKTTPAEVYGVLTFYHDFTREPQGRHILKLCRSESCQAVGANGIIDEVQKKLGIGFGETTRDGSLTLQPVYCLGMCSCSPAAMLDDRPMGKIDADSIVAAVAEVR